MALHSPFPAAFHGSCVSPWAVHWDLAASPALPEGPSFSCHPSQLCKTVQPQPDKAARPHQPDPSRHAVARLPLNEAGCRPPPAPGECRPCTPAQQRLCLNRAAGLSGAVTRIWALCTGSLSPPAGFREVASILCPVQTPASPCLGCVPRSYVCPLGSHKWVLAAAGSLSLDLSLEEPG